MYDFITHDLIFNDRIFAGSAQITTMKFHPIGMLSLQFNSIDDGSNDVGEL